VRVRGIARNDSSSTISGESRELLCSERPARQLARYNETNPNRRYPGFNCSSTARILQRHGQSKRISYERKLELLKCLKGLEVKKKLSSQYGSRVKDYMTRTDVSYIISEVWDG
jgi:hypothetical protein